MQPRHDNHIEEPQFDLTPMIDVVMLLIVFFMLTAQFAQTMLGPIDLPRESGDSDANRGSTVTIDLLANGDLKLDSEPMARERLLQLIALDLRRTGASAELDVIVRADRAAPAGHLNTLAGDLAGLGVRHWKLATNGGGQ